MKSWKLSKKQKRIFDDIVQPDLQKISVLGSVQSGKTYVICFSILEYAKRLYKYEPNTENLGAVIGWTASTVKGNILEPLTGFLDALGFQNKKDYDLKWGTNDEKYLKIYNLKLYFFGFNNVTSFNQILGKPLIFIWVDEAARIYTSSQLQASFDELNGRQLSFVTHPYYKTIHSFNVEGGERHAYKMKYIDTKAFDKYYVVFPFDNPKINTPEAMKRAIEIFPEGSLRDQKIYCKWVIGSGRVFPTINIIDTLNDLVFREIGLGNDYGSTNATTFVPIALCYRKSQKRYVLVRLEIYYHDPLIEDDNPTTEFYSKQLRLFMVYLRKRYPNVPITTNILDSEAKHFSNRLLADNIPHELAEKRSGSVVEGVQHLQSLMYKELFLIYKHDSIKFIHDNGDVEFSNKDDGIVEYESYQYDTVRSAKEGVDCYKKMLDHHIDATRYLISSWKEQGKCPIV